MQAYIATLSRPDPKSSKWNVTVKLNDGTATVDADLSEKVLTENIVFKLTVLFIHSFIHSIE